MLDNRPRFEQIALVRGCAGFTEATGIEWQVAMMIQGRRIVTRAGPETRLWAKITLKNKCTSEPTEGFRMTS